MSDHGQSTAESTMMIETPLSNDRLYELVKRIQKDDLQSGVAFEGLLREMRSWQLFTFARLADPEELFSILTCRLWTTKLRSFDGERGHFVKAYIQRAASNLYHEIRRNPRERGRQNIDDVVLQTQIAIEPDESAQLDLKELEEQIRSYFKTLDAVAQAVMQMTTDGASREDIVVETGLTLQQVTKIRCRCVAELRERLAGQGYHLPPKRGYHRKNEGVG